MKGPDDRVGSTAHSAIPTESPRNSSAAPSVPVIQVAGLRPLLSNSLTGVGRAQPTASLGTAVRNAALAAQHSFDPDYGRRVVRDLADAGLTDVGCEGRASTWRGGEAGGTVWRLTFRSIARRDGGLRARHGGRGATAQPSPLSRAAASMATASTQPSAPAQDLPVAWRVETAASHESNYVIPLLDKSKERGFAADTCALDKGYDVSLAYDACEDRDVRPIIPLRETPAVKAGKAGPPACEWRFAGADPQRKAAKWRCPTGGCAPASRWVKAGRLHPLIPRESKRWKSFYRAAPPSSGSSVA